MQFSKHDFSPTKFPNFYKIGSYQEPVKFIVFLVSLYIICPVMLGEVASKAASDLWNSQDGFQLCVHKILVQCKLLVFETSRGTGDRLLSEVAAGRRGRICVSG